MIDAATKEQIESKIREFRDLSSPTTELAVAVVRSTGDRDIFDYSLAVARGWKIGSDESDNPGALLFVAIDDRKYFTQVSRDLEDELPDGLVGSLQRQYLVPEFRKGNYGKGIADTVDAYIRTINERRGGIASPTATPEGTPADRGSTNGGFNWLCCIIIIGIILLILFSRRGGGPSGKDRDRWGGPGDVAVSALPWVIGSILSSGGGSDRSSGWGGGSSGGWGGGGFGGFGGGGDFGGGGAGGSW